MPSRQSVAFWMFAAACLSPWAAPEAQAKEACPDAAGFSVLAAPMTPSSGQPLRVMLTVDAAADAELTLTAPDGSIAAKSAERHGGPPYFWYAEVASPQPGKWKAKLAQSGDSSSCGIGAREITVSRGKGSAPGESAKSVWPIRNKWSRETENLYSAWIEKLFDAPAEESLSWPALHEVLRDKSRNVLHNYLGAREDEKGLVIKPDCADLPYFLRAYFAFKMGLPFGYSKCSRGGGGSAPRCVQWWNIVKEEPAGVKDDGDRPAAKPKSVLNLFGNGDTPAAARPSRPPGLVQGFGYYLRNVVANGVHSGSARTALKDDNTDYYPVPLARETLRPGTIFADPYGHVLVLVKRLAQTKDAAGVFLAVDGQPDGTVARKRFWRGNFLFAQDPGLGGPGFKRFRPITGGTDGLRRLTNAEISRSPDYGDYSFDQGQMDADAFYDRMDDVMSPEPLDPERAMLEAITSLEEQVKTRVTSVENGRKYQTGGGGEVSMPDGPSIFETTGAWEDFATPSRDLRLLIAIDVVQGFPARVERRPDRYAMPKDKSAADVRAALQQTLAHELQSRKFTYTRTDGSAFELALRDVLDRQAPLEMAYNVNDCVELRWGAEANSEEAATCKRRAPEAQRAKMGKYRVWFHERRRPARGVAALD